ncbi:sigma-54-dependent Fis family transcriptional regulator [Paraclostridium ghonii]|uniref:Transcriptional regulator of acetoin/glycerol metabolism n=1 Tax=Paraclostridium ghonii TaxID=29358 RepID=A0ABU0N3X2_9FIRM|nr:sigma-54-dependent Fis family transcriptional regulator [Paeniclostridium ghonii]MDQ0557831.1 transcriptional regulator of acetoin/glycerol metabolism [Paeniclostridium ghonii]
MEDYINFIKNAWEKFIKTDEVDLSVRKEIRDSWIRCKSYGVDYNNGSGSVKHNNIKNLIEKNRELISVSKPIMEGIYSMVCDSGFAIILSDREGYIIQVIGDKEIMNRANELNFLTGELWTENIVGTNAIGTALHLNKPIQTIGAEHYGKKQHSWTCSASPIYDEDGNLIGCINMAGNYYDAHSHTLGIVTAAAKSIQNQLALTLSYKLLNVTFESISEGMIVVNEDLSIKKVNGKALKILNMSLDEIMQINIEKILNDIDFYELLNEDKKINNVECDFNVKFNRVKCVLSITTLNINGKSTGFVITFNEVKKVHKLVNKLVGYKAQYTFKDIITENEKMKNMISFAKKISKTDCNILVEGESGTGKELIAQSIHNFSERKNGPFVAINCASIPRDLVESELFGYEKGAFTGAAKEGHPGKFELADGGTIFLDEIGELSLETQSKLLRVLDNKKVTRLGGTYEKQLDVRVIGATNRILKNEITKKNFRQDLYYRLSVMNIKTIPLRERIDDINVLVNYFIENLNYKNKSKKIKANTTYINDLKQYNWPGNIRELRNMVERDYYLSESYLISSSNFNNINSFKGEDINKTEEIIPLECLEKKAIEGAIKKCNGNMLKASKLLNIGRSTLYRKINKYNIMYQNETENI